MSTEPDPSLDELAAIALAARGNTNAQIGRALGLTEDGVKSRFARASLRLHTRNRAHTVAVCLSRGLIPLLREDTTA